MNCHNGPVFAKHSQQAHCKHITDTGAVQSQVAIFRWGTLFYQTWTKKISSEEEANLPNLIGYKKPEGFTKYLQRGEVKSTERSRRYLTLLKEIQK